MPVTTEGSSVVLVVDDDHCVLHMLRDYLEKRTSYRVLTATNGKEALALLRSVIVDLVVTDIFMPECDGYELILQLRSITDIPIVAVSGGSQFNFALTPDRVLKTALFFGANSVVDKPFRLRDFVFLLDSLLVARGYNY